MFFQSLLYNLCLPIIFVIYLPFYMKKQLKRGGMDAGFWERFGSFAKEKRDKILKQNDLIWIHSVSVGETVAALNFIEKWPNRSFVLSTTTTTGQAIARKRAPENVTVIYMPIDFRFAIKKAYNLIRPKMLVIFEVEIWPNLLLQANKRDIPVTLVNGRMSDKSYEGFKKHSWFFRPIFNLFSLTCVQSEADAKRFAGVSGDSLEPIVCNTMKFDQAPNTNSAISIDSIKKFFVTEKPIVFTAASTHPGEEKLIVDIYKKLKERIDNLVFILVPRHVERTPEIETMLKSEDVSYNLFNNSEIEPSDLLVVNVTGELLSLMSVSDVVYVGKSLAGNEGGHNIIEPAVFGKPVLHGKDMQNFRLVVEAFAEDKSSTVVSEETFSGVLEELLTNEEKRFSLGKAALQTVKSHSGAIEKTIGKLEDILL